MGRRGDCHWTNESSRRDAERDNSEAAISLHIYGTDITRIGSSVRRYYN
jgi:hypothetical protein